MLASGFNEVSSVIISTTANTTGESVELSADGANHLVSSAGQLPVYQEQPGELVLEKLQAYNYDVLVIDRCSRLVYHLIPPWSALNYPYVKAAILSTYIDEPCGPCQADRGSGNEEDDVTGSFEGEPSAERNKAASLAPFVKTKDETLPVRVVMRHPHTHRGRGETTHYRYIELQTGNPGYHGHLEGDGSSHMENPQSQSKTMPHSETTPQTERTPCSMTNPHSNTPPNSETIPQTETTPCSMTNPHSNTPPNSETTSQTETTPCSTTNPHSNTPLNSETTPCSDTTCHNKAAPSSDTKSNCQGIGDTKQGSAGTFQEIALTNKPTTTTASHGMIAQQMGFKGHNATKDHVVNSTQELAKKGNVAVHYNITTTKNTSISKPDLIKETILANQKQKDKTLRRKKIKGRKGRKKFYGIKDSAELHINKNAEEIELNQTSTSSSSNTIIRIQMNNKSIENKNLSETHEFQSNIKELNVIMSEELQTNWNDSTELFKDSIADESHILEHDLKENANVNNPLKGAQKVVMDIKEGDNNVKAKALNQEMLDESQVKQSSKQKHFNVVTHDMKPSQNGTAGQCNTNTCSREAQQGLHMRNKSEGIDPIANGIEDEVEKSKIKKVLIGKEEHIEYTDKTDGEKQNAYSKFLSSEEEELSALMNMIKGTDVDKGTRRKPLLTEHFGGGEDDPDWYSNTQQKLMIMHYAKLYPWLDFDM